MIYIRYQDKVVQKIRGGLVCRTVNNFGSCQSDDLHSTQRERPGSTNSWPESLNHESTQWERKQDKHLSTDWVEAMHTKHIAFDVLHPDFQTRCQQTAWSGARRRDDGSFSWAWQQQSASLQQCDSDRPARQIYSGACHENKLQLGYPMFNQNDIRTTNTHIVRRTSLYALFPMLTLEQQRREAG